MSDNKLIQISNKDWHYRLVRYCWGIDPTMFRNLCPYFWLSVASIFVCVPIFLYKVIKGIILNTSNLFYKLIDLMLRGCEKLIDETAYERKIKSLTKGQIYYILNHDKPKRTWEGSEFIYFSNLKKKTGKSYDKLAKDILRIHNINKKEFTEEYRTEYIREVAQEKKKYNAQQKKVEERLEKKRKKEQEERDNYLKKLEEKREREKKMYDLTKAVSKFTKNIFIAILLCILFFGFELITEILSSLVSWCIGELIGVDWANVGLFLLEVLGWSILGAILTIGLYYVIRYIVNAYDDKDNLTGIKGAIIRSSCAFGNYTIKFFYYIGLYLLYYPFYVFIFNMVICGIVMGFVEGFNEFGGIFRDYFNASYSDYCPGIDWKKEDNK